MEEGDPKTLRRLLKHEVARAKPVEREEAGRGAVEGREGGAGPLFGGWSLSRGFSGEVNLLDAVAYAEELFSRSLVGLPADAVEMDFVPA